MLTKKQLRDVCLVDDLKSQSVDVCRYCHYVGYLVAHCMKLSVRDRKKIDASCDKLIEKCKKKGVSLESTGEFFGDNCQGFPFLPNIKQGI